MPPPAHAEKGVTYTSVRIPSHLSQKIADLAKRNRRSIAGELTHLLETHVFPREDEPQKVVYDFKKEFRT